MSRWQVAPFWVLSIVCLTACSDISGPAAPSTILPPAASASAPRLAADGAALMNGASLRAARSTTSVIPFLGGAPIPGSSSTLVRNASGVTYTLMTSGLDPRSAYTNWFVVYNNPSLCSGPCSEDDDVFPGAPAGVSVIYATGHIVGATGQGSFAGRLNSGDTTGALFGPGLDDPYTAEIHIVVRSHGPAIPGMIHQQISTFPGGCEINVCADQQEALHLP